MSTPIDKITSQVQIADSKLQIPDENQIVTETGFYWRERDGVKILVCRPLEVAGFVNGFSTRGGGVSAFPENSLNLAGFDEDSAENIYENRRRFLKALGNEWEIASCWQVHGNGIGHVKNLADAADGSHKFDALVSDIRQI